MVPLMIGLALVVGFAALRLPRARTVAKGAAASAILAAAAAFVGPWEGLRTQAYLDTIASPDVWTVCYGETRGVQAGDSYTAEECASKLASALGEYRAKLSACVPALPAQPEGVQVALVSWSYNVGTGAACGSTLATLANAGDWRGACDQLPRWNKSGGKAVKGLTNRRAAERKLCLEALGV